MPERHESKRDGGYWEVLKGVGVEGGRRKRFILFLFVFFVFLGLFFVSLRFSLIFLEDKGKQVQFTAKWGISLRLRLPLQNFPK